MRHPTLVERKRLLKTTENEASNLSDVMTGVAPCDKVKWEDGSFFSSPVSDQSDRLSQGAKAEKTSPDLQSDLHSKASPPLKATVEFQHGQLQQSSA